MSAPPVNAGIAARLGAAAVARPWRALILFAVLAVAALGAGAWLQQHLSSSLADYSDPGAESSDARRQIFATTGVNTEEGFVVLVRTDRPLTPATPPPRVVSEVAEALRRQPSVVRVLDYATTRDPAMVSRDGRATYVIGQVGEVDEKEATADLKRALSAIDAPAGSIVLGGPTAANVEIAEISSKDLSIAESIAFPILLALLLVVFRGGVAASLPLLGGMLAILLALLALTPIAAATPVSVFALNLIFGLGLGLSIDFSLLIVSRYREELSVTGSGPEALRRTLATTGRTITFSCLTVSAALAALLVFPERYLRSMSIAGILVTVAAAVVAVVVLPAVLTLLGPRINALAPRRWQDRERRGEVSGFWYRFPQRVMRRPLLVALVAGGVLVALGAPLLGVRFTGVDAYVIPEGEPGRVVADALATEFPVYRTAPIDVVVEAPQDAAAAVAGHAREIARAPGVVDVTPPRYLGRDTWLVDAFVDDPPLSDAAQNTVEAVRDLSAPFPRLVGGTTARFMDIQASLGDRLPLGIALVVVTTLILLFVMTGSVILPIKALIMNLLSLSAALGVLVLVFQEGYGSSLLGFTSQGALESSTPILIVALVFGVSTDYEVFLLSRIKEAHDAGLPLREAVAVGLARTGRIVTAAALLFCVAVGALLLSRIIFIKELGLGTAFAVLVDATIVRAMLVPALMVVLGPWNWWAPRPLRALLPRTTHAAAAAEPASAPARDESVRAGR